MVDLKVLLINSIEQSDVLSFINEYSETNDIELKTELEQKK